MSPADLPPPPTEVSFYAADGLRPLAELCAADPGYVQRIFIDLYEENRRLRAENTDLVMETIALSRRIHDLMKPRPWWLRLFGRLPPAGEP